MSTPPRRHKTLEELTAADHEQRQQAAREGQPAPVFETDEYRQRRADVLARHGMADDPDRQD